MKKTVEFETTVQVSPGEIRHFPIELRLDEDENFCILGDLHLDKVASNFMILDLFWVHEDRSGTLMSQDSCLKEHYKLPGVLLPRGAFLHIAVKNLSSVPQIFKGCVDFEIVTGKLDKEPKPSLVERCKRWFVAGFEVAAKDRLAPEKQPPAYLALPSVRESARQIVASLASLVEIPAIAASLYWRELSGLSGIEDAPKISAIGLSSDQDSILSEKIIKLVLAKPFRPTSIHCIAGFDLVKLSIGGKNQLLSTDAISLDPMPGGVPLVCEAAAAGEIIEIVVRRSYASAMTFRGVLVGEVFPTSSGT